MRFSNVAQQKRLGLNGYLVAWILDTSVRVAGNDSVAAVCCLLLRISLIRVLLIRLAHLGPVAPISVNFNHQLAYFADQSDTTHVPHQPTTVA